MDRIETRKLLELLKADLTVLWEAHDRVENELKEFVSTQSQRVPIECRYNSTYIIWVLFSMNRQEHLKHLEKRFKEDVLRVNRRPNIDDGVLVFKPEYGVLSSEALIFSDGITLYFKHLQDTVDIDVPRHITHLPSIGYKCTVSILDTSGKFSDFRKEVDLYLIRVANILKKIDAASLDAPSNYNDKPWEYWKELVSEGKVSSVINLMKTHFQETGKDDYYDQIIVLSSRFSNYEQVMHQGIRTPENLGVEYQNIVNALMHLINSYKRGGRP
ncbi:MAG: hypothetical protein DHS20C18_44030 [Saprospiraceae bacterium]|nr:MAG: hypothetical protein DHS20C18_44030 [Saprospiraceae bacterium]